LSDDVAALFKLAVETVKPFEQQELHTVTICPEFKIPNQNVTQK
jgi:hypothetical protein